MDSDFPQFSCILCSGDAASLVVRQTDGRTIVRCRRCGLICVYPFPSDDELNVIYQSAAYFGVNRTDEGIGYSAYASQPYAASPVERERLRTLARLRPRRGTLLDVGCAYGSFLLLAREAGWQPLGLELSDPAARAARDQFGLNVITGTLQSAHLPDTSADAVTLWEVIEHVRSPLDELHEIARVLKPGGVVALSTPNAGSLRARQEGPDWYGFHVSREHLLFFTPGTLARALTTAGLHVAAVHTRRVDPSLRRLMGRRTAVASASAECHPGLRQPSPVLLSLSVQKLIHVREMMLRPLEAMGLGHNLEVYGVKPA